MRKTILPIAAIAALLVSCTERYSPADTDYYVEEGGVFLFTAQVESLTGEYVWDATRCKVGVYSPGSDNTVFRPRASYHGLTGEVQVFGPAVTGQAFAYIPWSKDGNDAAALGCQPIPSNQVYCTDAMSQIEDNTPVMVAAAGEDGRLDFRYLCGALHLKVKINLGEEVRSLTLSANEPVCGWADLLNGGFAVEGNSVNVSGIDKKCTESSPLDIYVMMPEGTYTGVYVTLAGDTQTNTAIIEGELTITAGESTAEVLIVEKKNSYGGSEFESEEVDYD